MAGTKNSRKRQYEATESDDILGTEENQRVVLKNVGADRSDSTKRSTNTAMVHFEKYLEHQKFRVHKFDDMLLKDFSQDLFGKFADYLMLVADTKTSGTALDYLSCVKTKILSKFPTTQTFIDESWYKFTRKNTKKFYIKQKMDKIASGEEPDNTTTGTSMTEAHHDYIGLALFMDGSTQAIADRALLALNWPCIGEKVVCCTRSSIINYVFGSM